MNARHLAQLAAEVAAHGPLLIESDSPLSESGLQHYWTASKCRTDRWGHALRQFQREADELGPNWARATWPAIECVIDEVFTSELLTRVWTAVVCGYDLRHESADGEPVVRSILSGHLEIRHRALQLLLQVPVGREDVDRLNRLRSRCERWSDLLVGCLLSTADVSSLASAPQRARDFSENLADQRRSGTWQQGWSLTLGALRTAFPPSSSEPAANHDLNARIAASVLACFPPELFHATGLFRSLWVTRLVNSTNDVEGMLGQLLDNERPPTLPPGRINWH